MDVRVNETSKTAEVWLSRDEQEDAALRARMKPMYADFRKKGYLVAVFLSGDQDLYQQTSDLLKFNRKRTAQREVEWEKQSRAAM